jgi:hypothetical protein
MLTTVWKHGTLLRLCPCSWEDLLPGEAGRAADALEAWRTSSACEAKLNRALRDGCSSAQLSRLITEAAAAGVKVAAARRILKLQQLLEAAMAAADEPTGASSSQHSALAAKLEAAEQGGVAAVVLEPARLLLQRLAAHEARQALEAALKPHSDLSANTHIAALRVALDKAEDVLGVPVQELAKQQQQQEQQREGLQQEQQQHGEDSGQEALSGDGRQQQQQQQDAGDAQGASSTGPEVAASSSADEAGAAAAGPTEAAAEPAADEAKQRDQEQQQGQQQQQQAGPGSASKLSKAGSVSSSMHRTDSTASSVADMPSAAAAAAAAGSGLGVGQRVGTHEGSVSSCDVGAAVAELAVRAWQLLQQHTQQLEAIDRERAEQERARREVKEVRAAEDCWSCVVSACFLVRVLSLMACQDGCCNSRRLGFVESASWAWWLRCSLLPLRASADKQK